MGRRELHRVSVWRMFKAQQAADTGWFAAAVMISLERPFWDFAAVPGGVTGCRICARSGHGHGCLIALAALLRAICSLWLMPEHALVR